MSSAIYELVKEFELGSRYVSLCAIQVELPLIRNATEASQKRVQSQSPVPSRSLDW